MKSPLLLAGGVLIVVILIVLLVPGVRDQIEGQVLGWLARFAS